LLDQTSGPLSPFRPAAKQVAGERLFPIFFASGPELFRA